MINRQQIDDYVTQLQSNTSGRLHAYQKAKVPNFLDITFKRVSTYWKSDGKEYPYNNSQYTCIKVSELNFVSQSFSMMNKYYDNIAVKTLVDTGVLYPFLLFINKKFVKWSEISIISNNRENYIMINDYDIAHTTIDDVQILSIPFNILYKENGPATADNISHIFKFDSNGLLKQDNSALYTYISVVNSDIYWEDSSSTTGFKYKVCTIDPSLSVFEENFTVFKDGLLYRCPITIYPGNIVTIDSGNSGVYTLVYKLIYNMTGNYNKDNISKLSGIDRNSLASYYQAKDTSQTYPTWLDDAITPLELTTEFTEKSAPVWTMSADMNLTRANHSTVGTNSNTLVAGGGNGGISTELFNSISWSNSANMNIKRYYHGGCGVSNSALITGGYDGTSVYYNSIELFNGSTWTNGVNMNSIRTYHAMCGVSNNALSIGGWNGNFRTNTTEVFNGTTWTNSVNMNNIRYRHTGCGISNNTLITGGNDTSTIIDTTEVFNGTTWTNSANMNDKRYDHSTIGTSNNALIAGGRNGSTYYNTTEVFNGANWTISINMNSIRAQHSSCGLSNNALTTGGYNGTYVAKSTEIFTYSAASFSDDLITKINQYDPTLFTDLYQTNNNVDVTFSTGSVFNNGKNKTTNEYPLPRRKLSNSQDEGLLMMVNGLLYSDTKLSDNKMIVNVKSDTSSNAWRISSYMNNVRGRHRTCGTSSNALTIAGFNTAELNTTEAFSNSVWSSSINANTPRYYFGACGISNNSLIAGGTNSSILNTSELFNGSTWNLKNNLNIGRMYTNQCGVSNSALIIAGKDANAYLNSTELFNGTTWTNSSNINIIRGLHSASGISNSCMIIGGSNNDTFLNSTEVWNGTTWSSGVSTTTLRNNATSIGSTNSLAVIGGIITTSLTVLNTTEVWNGTAWSSGLTTNINRYAEGSCGSDSSNILITGGDTNAQTPTFVNNTEIYTSYSNIQPELVWSNMAYMNGIRGYHAQCGVSNNALVTGGSNGGIILNNIELFNGSVWTNSVNMSSIRYYHSMCGVSNNALVIDGRNTGTTYYNTTELFNGTTWSDNVNTNSVRYSHAACGVSNNALVTGGSNASTNLNTTELFNGTTWTNSVNMNNIRNRHAMCGVSNNALVTGGYNGSTWTNSTNMNSIRYNHAMCGISNNALATGGSTTELFNGTTWTNSTNMNNKRQLHAQCGISNNTLVAGGWLSAGASNTTEIGKNIHNIYIKNNDFIELLTFKGIQNKVLCGKIDSNEDRTFLDPDMNLSTLNIYSNILDHTAPYYIWSNGANMNSVRSMHAMCGIQLNSLVSGGAKDSASAPYNTTELFNGTIWTNSINTNTARRVHAMCGVSNTALICGGSTTGLSTGGGSINTTELWNGTVWTNSTNMNSNRYYNTICGISNNALVTGGSNTSGNASNTTELWNGTVWTNSVNMNSIRSAHAQCGISNNALVTGGRNNTTAINTTEIFNGTVWTNNANLNSIRNRHCICGISNNALVTGGGNGSNSLNTTEIFDTINWTNITNINNNREFDASCGDSNNALVVGGDSNYSVFYNTIELGQYYEAYSLPSTGDQLFTIPYYKINTTDGHYKIKFNDSKFFNTPVYFANPNQYRINSFIVANGDYSFKLDFTFRTCQDISRYVVFHNGHKLTPKDYVITLFNRNKPYYEQRLYPYTNMIPGDKLDVVYLPYPVIELAYDNPSIPLTGDITITKATSNIPLDRALIMVFLNGKKIPNSNLINVDSQTICIKNTESIEHLSILKFMDDNEVLVNSFLGNSSKFDSTISKMTSDEVRSLLGIGSISVSNTEYNMSGLRETEQSVWMEITRDFYNAIYGIDQLGFADTIDGSSYIVNGADTKGVETIPANDASKYISLETDRQIDH